MSLYGETNTNSDVEVAPSCMDKINTLAFHPHKPILLASSWNNLALLYNVTRPLASLRQSGKKNKSGRVRVTACPCNGFDHGAPVLCTAFKKEDPDKFYTGGIGRNEVKLWDAARPDTCVRTMGRHAAGVKACAVLTDGRLVTGSYDGKLHFWDSREDTKNTVENSAGGKVYSIDSVANDIIAAGQSVAHLDLRDLNRSLRIRRLEQALSSKKVAFVNSVACFKVPPTARFGKHPPATGMGFALACENGRVAIRYMSEWFSKKGLHNGYTFKVKHKADKQYHAVNQIALSPSGRLATVGANGRYYFWDHYARIKALVSEKCENSLTCCAWWGNQGNSVLAYAVGYDGSRGFARADEYTKKPNKIYLSGREKSAETS